MSLQSHDHVERIKHVRRPKKTPAERARRAEAGRERARLFSWDRTAELTLAALRRVAR